MTKNSFEVGEVDFCNETWIWGAEGYISMTYVSRTLKNDIDVLLCLIELWKGNYEYIYMWMMMWVFKMKLFVII